MSLCASENSSPTVNISNAFSQLESSADILSMLVLTLSTTSSYETYRWCFSSNLAFLNFNFKHLINPFQLTVQHQAFD